MSALLEIRLREYLALIEGNKECGRREFQTSTPMENSVHTRATLLNPGSELGRNVSKRDLEEHLSLLEIRGLNKGWSYRTGRILINYLDFVGWYVSMSGTIDYLKVIKQRLKTSSFRKSVYQIRKFLVYLDMKWAHDIKPPSEPEYKAKRITTEDIRQTLDYFVHNGYFQQFKAIILLGGTSGLRAEELYQLTSKDIDLTSGVVHINHNPSNGQTTKTGRSRVAFFNEEARQALTEYLDYFNGNNNLKCLFSKTHIERAFRHAPLKAKDLRKYFSQEWDRRGGPTSIKKILMGHSLKGDVDLNHYNAQSEEDLKAIYNRVDIKILKREKNGS